MTSDVRALRAALPQESRISIEQQSPLSALLSHCVDRALSRNWGQVAGQALRPTQPPKNRLCRFLGERLKPLQSPV